MEHAGGLSIDDLQWADRTSLAHLDQAIEMGDAGHAEVLRGLVEDPSVFA